MRDDVFYRGCGLGGLGIEGGHDQERLFAAGQQQAEKPFMRVAGKTGQVINMLRVGKEQAVEAVFVHGLFQGGDSIAHGYSSFLM